MDSLVELHNTSLDEADEFANKHGWHKVDVLIGEQYNGICPEIRTYLLPNGMIVALIQDKFGRVRVENEKRRIVLVIKKMKNEVRHPKLRKQLDRLEGCGDEESEG